MALPSVNDLRTTTEKTVSFIQWLAELLRSKNWFIILILIGVFVGIFLNPISIATILTPFSIGLHKYYTPGFVLVTALIFGVALIKAIRSMPRKPATPILDIRRRSTIKGPRPFGFDDAEIFARLQREQILTTCVESISGRDFVFGILSGESGCGKSSFLQAGLWPRLEQQQTPHRCVYVKFTDLDPFDSIRQAINEQLKISKEKLEGASLLNIFTILSQAEPIAIVLLFDQFEQFFVHRKLRMEREPFIAALTDWYQTRHGSPVKILVSIRNDFTDRLIELQKVMGYSLGPQHSFRLEKFDPQQATEVFKAIAETEQLAFDEGFINQMVSGELASREDGLISPVDLQILAWMIAGQTNSGERAFNRKAFQMLGGVEGLLERFLSRALEARETEGRRQAAIKVLLVLTDLDRNVRAGVMTLADVEKKVAGTLTRGEAEEAIEWLARGDVRLITPNNRNGTVGYEIAHERLIPALRSLAGKQLSEVEKANLLLDGRVNEWLGNDRASRYLLTWRELRLIRRQRPYLIWGTNKGQKQTIISQSKRHLIIIFGRVLLPLLLLICVGAWQYSRWSDYQLAQTTIAALDQNRDISANEAVQFQQLFMSSWRRRRAAIDYAFENVDASSRALQHVEMLTHAVVELDSTGNYSAEIVENILSRLAFLKPGEPSADLSIALLHQLRIVSAESIADNLLALTRAGNDQSVQITIIRSLLAVADKLESDGAVKVTQQLVPLLRTSQNPEIQAAVLQVIESVGGKLKPQSVESVLKELAAITSMENDSVEESMARTLHVLVLKLEPDHAERIFTELRQRLKSKENSPVRRAMARVFSSVSTRLQVKDPETMYMELAEWIKVEPEQFVIASVTGAIHGISRNLEPTQAERISKNLLLRVKTEEKLYQRQAFARMLGTFARQLEPQYAHAFFKELLDLAQSEQDRSVQNSVIAALQTVASRLDPKNAEQRFTEILALLKPRQQFFIRRALPRILHTLGARIGIESAEQLFKNLVGQLRVEWDVPVWRALPEALGAVASKLEPKNAEERFRDLLLLAKSKRDPAFQQPLITSFQAVSNKLYPNNAEGAFKELMEWLKDENDESVSKTLGGITPVLASKLEANNAAKMFDYLLELLRNERRNHSFRRSLPTALRAVASRFEANIAEIKFNALLEITKKEEESNVRRSLVEVLSTMARKLDAEHAEIKFKQSMDWIKTEQDSSVQTAMIDLLRVLGRRLEANRAQTEAQNLIDLIKSDRQPFMRRVRLNILEAIGIKLEPKTAESVSKDLVDLIKNDRDPSNVTLLTGTLRAVSANVDSQVVEKLRQELIVVMKTQKDQTIFQALNSGIIRTLEKRFPTNDKNVSDRLQDYVDLLKGYEGGVPLSRTVILENIEIITSEAFDGDKWRFVKWATSPSAAKFRLNLD